MRRVINFSAGPAVLPQEVLARAADELLDWHGTGMSVMEMSLRSEAFISIAAQAEADFRELLSIPTNYKVLFLSGGATLQFSALPMNLLGTDQSADYVVTGEWSKKAFAAAQAIGNVRVAASSESQGFHATPAQAQWQLDPKAAYVHYCSNETIGGVEFHWTPQVGDVPLIADASSHLLSRPIDVSRFGVIYGGAQKNVGPAGITIVIVRDDLLGRARAETPGVLNYALQAAADSMLNTPATYPLYMAGLVFKWLKALGGVAEIERRNMAKAKLLYDFIDASTLYRNPVNPADRSRMNVPFTLADPSLDQAFLDGARDQGMLQLKGHRLSGGMRASIYNAMPIEAVQLLVQYMRDFEQRH